MFDPFAMASVFAFRGHEKRLVNAAPHLYQDSGGPHQSAAFHPLSAHPLPALIWSGLRNGTGAIAHFRYFEEGRVIQIGQAWVLLDYVPA